MKNNTGTIPLIDNNDNNQDQKDLTQQGVSHVNDMLELDQIPLETKHQDPYQDPILDPVEEIKSFLLTGNKSQSLEQKSMNTFGFYKSTENNKICLPCFDKKDSVNHRKNNNLPFAEHRINTSRVSVQYPLSAPKTGIFTAKDLAKSTQASMEELSGVEIEQANLEWLYNCSFQKISLLDSEHTAKYIIDENIAASQKQEEKLILFGDDKKQLKGLLSDKEHMTIFKEAVQWKDSNTASTEIRIMIDAMMKNARQEFFCSSSEDLCWIMEHGFIWKIAQHLGLKERDLYVDGQLMFYGLPVYEVTNLKQGDVYYQCILTHNNAMTVFRHQSQEITRIEEYTRVKFLLTTLIQTLVPVRQNKDGQNFKHAVVWSAE